MYIKDHDSRIFIPDNASIEEAFNRTTHLAVSAHQDDIELMASHGILQCFGNRNEWFFGVVVTDGAGSSRNSIYKNLTPEELKEVRKKEQRKAAYIGEYSGVAFLDYKSDEAKDKNNKDIIGDLKDLISLTNPGVVYTHNLADKHDTHVAVALKAIYAMRELEEDKRPAKVYGCEVWRSLDWVCDYEKVALDVDKSPNISRALVEVFDSQVSGGKRYDLAAMGRRLSNATFNKFLRDDESKAFVYAMDLTPLIYNLDLDIEEFVFGYIDRFKKDVSGKISKFSL